MNMCYFNQIPPNPDNHYSRVLSLKLLKNYESFKITHKQDMLDKTIIQSRSNLILHGQEACRSLLPSADALTASTPLKTGAASAESPTSGSFSSSEMLANGKFPLHASDLESYLDKKTSGARNWCTSASRMITPTLHSTDLCSRSLNSGMPPHGRSARSDAG